jgi:multimeric flavodoxin WrbA
MKILAVSFSPRKKGNTEILLGEALRGAKAEGAEVELYSVSGKNIQPCDGCRTCFREDSCRIDDDMQELYEKLLAADGIIFGTPVYFFRLTAQGKAVIDRTYAFNRPEKSLANKVGGVIAVAGSIGVVDAVKDLYFYMVTQRMLPANYVAAYGGAKGDVNKLEKGKQAAFELGREMVQLVAKGFEYPAEFPAQHFAYGTHTF